LVRIRHLVHAHVHLADPHAPARSRRTAHWVKTPWIATKCTRTRIRTWWATCCVHRRRHGAHRRRLDGGAAHKQVERVLRHRLRLVKVR
jgi:hypothetical protein